MLRSWCRSLLRSLGQHDHDEAGAFKRGVRCRVIRPPPCRPGPRAGVQPNNYGALVRNRPTAALGPGTTGYVAPLCVREPCLAGQALPRTPRFPCRARKQVGGVPMAKTVIKGGYVVPMTGRDLAVPDGVVAF